MAMINHGGGLTRAQARLGGAWEDWLDLSTGINPLPPTLPVLAPHLWQRLPDERDVAAARAAAARFYKTSCLPLPVPGVQSVIQLLPRLCGRTRRVAVFAPTYGEYAHVFRCEGFDVDLVQDMQDITRAHGLVVIVNPNNPTGHIWSREHLLDLAAQLRAQDAWLVIDEAFCDPKPALSLADCAGQLSQLLVLRSFGKFFGLAGLRLGFVLGDMKILDQIEAWLGPWAVSGPALHIAAHLLQQDCTSLALSLQERRGALSRCLLSAEMKIIGSTDFFALVQHEDAAKLYEHLAQRHILVRIFDERPNWMRFGLTADDASDARLLAALRGFARSAV